MRGEISKWLAQWWRPVLVVAVFAVIFLSANASDHRYRVYVCIGTILAATGFVGLWVSFRVFRLWGKRLVSLAAFAGVGILVAVALRHSVTMVGSDGSGRPILDWRWTVRDELTDLPDVAQPSVTFDQNSHEGVEFPQFLGPQRNGHVPGIRLSPDWESRPPELMWIREIGPGWSGFAIAAGRAVTQEQRGGKELVSCYSLDTGAPLWIHESEARFSHISAGDGPRSTPTIDGGRVYAIGAEGHLNCIDLLAGKLLWGRNILSDHSQKSTLWGMSCSALVHDGRVIVSGGAGPGPSLIAYSAVDGTFLWAASEGDGGSYASPVVSVIDGVEQIVTINAKSVSGHNPEDGATLWSFDWPGERTKVGQPIVIDGSKVLLTASYSLGSFLLTLTKGKAGRFEVVEEWRSNWMRTKFSSAVVAGGFAYGLDQGRIACIDLTDGTRRWREAKYGYGQNLLVGNHLLIQGDRGEVILVEPNPDRHNELARFSALDGKTWTPPAIAGDLLLVRNASEAACYRLPLAQ